MQNTQKRQELPAQHSSSPPAHDGGNHLSPRRIPLLAGEQPGHVIADANVQLLTAADGQQTAIWLQNTTIELRRLRAIAPDECLVSVAVDLSYGVTDAGRLVIF